ncbi:Cyclin-K [Strongyloides ratti]|uniref:Cyclin-K n=1 Tax=Strongyloides ratti TaxID=34506 RepID=A0A090L684_STRRB|nr:Cyclin-K [Strongyloides ratti]CEF65311.1 Cyclin-K [Strongyloides ratti]
MATNNWIFNEEDMNNTPSQKKGWSSAAEKKKRVDAIDVIRKVGIQLNISLHGTLYTASVYLQRFYMFHSFDEYNYMVTALGCLFLAGKVEETPKKIKDIISAAREIYSNALPYNGVSIESVIEFERILLRTMKFDLTVEAPYDPLLEYCKLLKIPKKQQNSVAQTGWGFLNDCTYTHLPLLWEAEIIAIGAIHLSLQMNNIENVDYEGRTNDEPWWSKVVGNFTLRSLEGICHKFLDHYSEQSDKNKVDV